MAKMQNKEQEVEVKVNKKEKEEGLDTQALLALITQLQGEISDLKKAQNSAPVVEASAPTVDNTNEILLKTIMDSKTNKEVTIVHNRQMGGTNLATLIKLDNYRTKLRNIGEERVLTYQQFEQFISKYPAYIERDIVLLHPRHQDLAEKFHMRCYQTESKEYLTQGLLAEIGKASVARIEEIYNSLNEESRNSLLSFWLGKCYEKDKNFYDRYKLDLLKRLSQSKVFDVMIHELNFES